MGSRLVRCGSGARRRVSGARLLSLALGGVLAVSIVSCAGTGPEALRPCDGSERVTILPGDPPTITWQPRCEAGALEVLGDGINDGVWWDVYARDAYVVPPIRYGITPGSANTHWPAAPLARGREYEVVLVMTEASGASVFLPPDTVSLPLPVRASGAPPQPGPHVLVELAGQPLPASVAGVPITVRAETLYFSASGTYRYSGNYRITQPRAEYDGPLSGDSPYKLVGADSVMLSMLAAPVPSVYGRYVGDTLVMFRDAHYCRTDLARVPQPCPPIARYVRR